MKQTPWVGFITVATFALSAHAACPPDIDTALMAARYANLQPAPNPQPEMTVTFRRNGAGTFRRIGASF